MSNVLQFTMPSTKVAPVVHA